MLTVLKPGSEDQKAALYADVERGDFIVEVTTTGELSAERSTNIMGPVGAREYGIRQMTIQSIVDEGTVVKKGDQVAALDVSELYDKMQAELDNVDNETNAYENARLDTALTLRTERDKLKNLEYQIEEKKLTLEQAQYEPPATIKKYENELEKAQRDLLRAQENYTIKVEQAKAKMQEQNYRLKRARDKYNRMKDLLEDFTIKAPQDGMVIYAKGFTGDRIVEGSTISPWNPKVATLPDLSSMISTTYINEVDIRKVKAGQQVEIGLDAFPEKKLSGKVLQVARVGQQNPNSDAKVFEVVIRLNEKDSDLRPAMTTSNMIVTEQLTDALYIPLECLHVHNDSINYVIKKSGTLQEVKVGLTNSNEAVVELGIEEGDVLYMSKPQSAEGREPKLLAELNGKRQEKYEQNEIQEAAPEEEFMEFNGKRIKVTPEMKKRIDQFKKKGGSIQLGTMPSKANGQKEKQGASQPSK